MTGTQREEKQKNGKLYDRSEETNGANTTTDIRFTYKHTDREKNKTGKFQKLESIVRSKTTGAASCDPSHFVASEFLSSPVHANEKKYVRK